MHEYFRPVEPLVIIHRDAVEMKAFRTPHDRWTTALLCAASMDSVLDG
jgi:hypothetical protein